MPTYILTLAITLAISFSAVPAAAITDQKKCDAGKLLAAANFSQCRIKVDSLAVKKGAALTDDRKLELEAKCETKLTRAYGKLERKYPETMSGGDDECSRYGDAANMIAALVTVVDAVADGTASEQGSHALFKYQAVKALCEAAGGDWLGHACNLT